MIGEQVVIILPITWVLTTLVLYAVLVKEPVEKIPIPEQNITSAYYDDDDVLYILSETEEMEDRWVDKPIEAYLLYGAVYVTALIAEFVIATDCKAGIFGIP